MQYFCILPLKINFSDPVVDLTLPSTYSTPCKVHVPFDRYVQYFHFSWGALCWSNQAKTYCARTLPISEQFIPPSVFDFNQGHRVQKCFNFSLFDMKEISRLDPKKEYVIVIHFYIAMYLQMYF